MSPLRRENESRDYLLRQLETAWKLTGFHLDGLTTEECLWRPAAQGLHVHRLADGKWRADWPDRESYDLGPPSIAWVTWHMVFWWSMALDHNFRGGTLAREAVMWPGSADAVRSSLGRLHDEWHSLIDKMSDDDLRTTERTGWPFRDRPFGDVVAWVNIELTKNASEIGYARFLHAVPTR